MPRQQDEILYYVMDTLALGDMDMLEVILSLALAGFPGNTSYTHEPYSSKQEDGQQHTKSCSVALTYGPGEKY